MHKTIILLAGFIFLLASCGTTRSGVLKYHRIDRSASNSIQKQVASEHVDDPLTFNIPPFSTLKMNDENYPVTELPSTEQTEIETGNTQTVPSRLRQTSNLRALFLSTSFTKVKSFVSVHPEQEQKEKEKPSSPTIKSKAQCVRGTFGILWAAVPGLFGLLLLFGLGTILEGFLAVLFIGMAVIGLYFLLVGVVRYIGHLDTRVGENETGKTKNAFRIAGLIYLGLIAFVLLGLLVLLLL